MNCVFCGKELSGRQKKYCSNYCHNKYFGDVSNSGYRKKYYEANKEKLKEYGKEYGKKNREINPEKQKESTRKWRKKNSEKLLSLAHERRVKERNLPSGFTNNDWKKALEYFENKCAYCGNELHEPHREHFIPVMLGGGFTKDNIVPACRSCNSGKRDKNPLDWLVTKVHGLVTYIKVIQYLQNTTP